MFVYGVCVSKGYFRIVVLTIFNTTLFVYLEQVAFCHTPSRLVLYEHSSVRVNPS